LRGANRRGNPHQLRHCEEQSDVAIHIQVVQDERWIASPSARNDPNSCHCEKQSDVAIHISGGARRQMDCFASGSQWQWGWLAMTVGGLAVTAKLRQKIPLYLKENLS